jgi:hypothetical protein
MGVTKTSAKPSIFISNVGLLPVLLEVDVVVVVVVDDDEAWEM